VGPYREPAEDVEAGLDALEISAFRAAVARRTRRIRFGVVLTVLGMVIGGFALAAVLPSIWFPTPPTPEAARVPRCEMHLIWPASGEPIPMTICR
jgi:hypothetical protein